MEKQDDISRMKKLLFKEKDENEELIRELTQEVETLRS